MRCAACHRLLREAAYTAPASLGAWVLGPVCLQKQLLSSPHESMLVTFRHRKRGSNVIPATRTKRVDKNQRDLFCDAVENLVELD